MNYLLQTAISTGPDEFIGTAGYLVVDLAILIQSQAISEKEWKKQMLQMGREEAYFLFRETQ